MSPQEVSLARTSSGHHPGLTPFPQSKLQQWPPRVSPSSASPPWQRREAGTRSPLGTSLRPAQSSAEAAAPSPWKQLGPARWGSARGQRLCTGSKALHRPLLRGKLMPERGVHECMKHNQGKSSLRWLSSQFLYLYKDLLNTHCVLVSGTEFVRPGSHIPEFTEQWPKHALISNGVSVPKEVCATCGGSR